MVPFAVVGHLSHHHLLHPRLTLGAPCPPCFPAEIQEESVGQTSLLAPASARVKADFYSCVAVGSDVGFMENHCRSIQNPGPALVTV